MTKMPLGPTAMWSMFALEPGTRQSCTVHTPSHRSRTRATCSSPCAPLAHALVNRDCRPTTGFGLSAVTTRPSTGCCRRWCSRHRASSAACCCWAASSPAARRWCSRRAEPPAERTAAAGGTVDLEELTLQASQSTVFADAQQAARPPPRAVPHAEQCAGKRSPILLATMTTCIGLSGPELNDLEGPTAVGSMRVPGATTWRRCTGRNSLREVRPALDDGAQAIELRAGRGWV